MAQHSVAYSTACICMHSIAYRSIPYNDVHAVRIPSKKHTNTFKYNEQFTISFTPHKHFTIGAKNIDTLYKQRTSFVQMPFNISTKSFLFDVQSAHAKVFRSRYTVPDIRNKSNIFENVKYRLVTNQVQMKTQDESRPLFCMELRSASIRCLQK